jgi:SAM-dependent methyltransferase
MEEEWSSMAQDYAITFANSLSPLYNLLYSKIPTQDSKNIRVLDWGCGSGHFSRYLGKILPSAHIISCDFAPGMINLANQLNNQDNVEFRVAKNPKEVEGEFDVIVSSLMIMYVLDRAELLNSLERKLKKNGVFIEAHWGRFDNVGWARVLKQSGMKRLFSKEERDQDPSCRLFSVSAWREELSCIQNLEIISIEISMLLLEWNGGVLDILKFGGLENDKDACEIGLDQARMVTGRDDLKINDPIVLPSEIMLTVARKS